MFRILLAVEDVDLSALLAVAIEQKNWFLLVLVAVLILVPLVLKLLGKSFPGQDLVVKLLTGVAELLAKKKVAPPPESLPENQPGQSNVIRILDEKEPK